MNPALRYLAIVGDASEAAFAYTGGLAQLLYRSVLALFASPLKRGRSLERAIHQAKLGGVGAIPSFR